MKRSDNVKSNNLSEGLRNESHEVDLSKIIKTVSRNRKLILSITFASLFLSTGYAFLKRPVWEGRFQIVLAKNKSISSDIFNAIQGVAAISPFIDGSFSGEDDLKTEVEILKSPSILMPIFDYVKRNKIIENGPNKFATMRYESWFRNNLKINLTKRTSVLNISYRDESKTLILPVLDKISEAFKTYSNKDRAFELEDGLSYLDNQISKAREISNKSLREMQSYAIEQDLSIIATKSEEIPLLKIVNVEQIRVDASNEVRKYDERLNQLKSMSYAEMMLYNSESVALRKLQLDIEELDKEISLKQTVFKKNDPYLESLFFRKNAKINLLKNYISGDLKAKRTKSFTRMRAAERPKGVLIKYSELLRKAVQDENSLSKLEVQKNILSLEKARTDKPWELITNPTIMNKPVSVGKKKIMFVGMIGGFFTSLAIALLRDKKKDIVYYEDEMQKFIDIPQLIKLPLSEIEKWNDLLTLLSSGKLQVEAIKTIGLISIGEIDSSYIKQIKEIFSKSFSIIESSNLIDTKDCDEQILITQIGVTKLNEILNYKEQLSLQGKTVLGTILIS